MSKIETNTIDTISGTTNLTIGSTNSSTVTFESGAATGHMYPAFEAYLGSDQTGISDSTYTKVEFNTEKFDTNSTYDNSSNYRFTPAIAGKYFIYADVNLQTTGGNELDLAISAIYKNGSIEKQSTLNAQSASMLGASIPVYGTIDLNTTDYIEIFAYIARTSGGSRDIMSGTQRTHFGAYRIGA